MPKGSANTVHASPMTPATQQMHAAEASAEDREGHAAHLQEAVVPLRVDGVDLVHALADGFFNGGAVHAVVAYSCQQPQVEGGGQPAGGGRLVSISSPDC